jgi:hypothetical protein
MRVINNYHAHDFCAAPRQKGRNTALAEALRWVDEMGLKSGVNNEAEMRLTIRPRLKVLLKAGTFRAGLK